MKTFSHWAFEASLEIKDAIMLGAVRMEEAKITGMTPAELILIGKKEARAIEGEEPPFPAC